MLIIVASYIFVILNSLALSQIAKALLMHPSISLMNFFHVTMWMYEKGQGWMLLFSEHR